MRIVNSVEEYQELGEGPCAFTHGVFDGVHRGHRALLDMLVRAARKRDQRAVGMTFHPHPRAVLTGKPPLLLANLDQRVALIGAAGLDTLILQRFTRDLANVEAEDYLADILLGRVGVRTFVLGEDTCFGRGKKGDEAFLRRRAEPLEFEVLRLESVFQDSALVSSSRVRDALAAGDVGEVRALLGRAYALAGTVVRGAGRGRMLGFPTANVHAPGMLFPAPGVYACRADVGNGCPNLPAVANVGRAPTFNTGPSVSFEVHLLDFDADIYGHAITVHIEARLREERRFESPAALVKQIHQDARLARDVLFSPG